MFLSFPSWKRPGWFGLVKENNSLLCSKPWLRWEVGSTTFSEYLGPSGHSNPVDASPANSGGPLAKIRLGHSPYKNRVLSSPLDVRLDKRKIIDIFDHNCIRICACSIQITWLKLINLQLKESRAVVEYWYEHHWRDISPGWPSVEKEMMDAQKAEYGRKEVINSWSHWTVKLGPNQIMRLFFLVLFEMPYIVVCNQLGNFNINHLNIGQSLNALVRLFFNW